MNIEEDFIYDVRIRDRMLAKGELKKEQVEERLAALQDVENQAELVELPQPAVGSAGGDDGGSEQ